MSTHFSVKDTANQLQVSVQRVRTLCRDKHLDAEKLGNSWVVSKDSVVKYGLKASHNIAEDHPAYRSPTRSSKKPIALSFFSGAMGLDLGIEKAGFEIRLACEFDKYCRQTITLNRPNVALLNDINNHTAKDVLIAAGLDNGQEVDLIMGGPPCQAFSTAGNRNGFNDDRGNAFLKYLDLALEIRPKYLVIENVRGLLSCPMMHRPHEKRGEGFPNLSEDELKGGALNFVLNRIKKSGYGYSFNLYNSANFGTPQVRERVIIICSRDGKTPPYLTPTHSQINGYNLPKWKTFKSAVRDLNQHHSLSFPEKRLKYYRILKAGQNWKDLPLELQKEALGKSFYSGGGKTGFLRRLAWDKPAPTLVTHPAMPATDLAHPDDDRPLSIEEYKRIQEFPDSWDLAGPLIQQYKQIGNAVPVSLGFAVGKLIFNLLNDIEVVNTSNFPYSRYRKTTNIEWEEEFKCQVENHLSKKTQAELEFS